MCLYSSLFQVYIISNFIAFVTQNRNKIVIYSHGNYEDLGENFDDINNYSRALQV